MRRLQTGMAKSATVVLSYRLNRKGLGGPVGLKIEAAHIIAQQLMQKCDHSGQIVGTNERHEIHDPFVISGSMLFPRFTLHRRQK